MILKIYKDRLIEIGDKTRKSKGAPRRRIAPEDFFHYLGSEIEIDEKVTFSTIMELLQVNEKLVDVVFKKTMGSFPFRLFYNDFKQSPSKDSDLDRKSDYIEISYHPDMWLYEKNDKIELSHIWDIHIMKKDEDIAYSLSFVKLADMKHLRITISPNVDFIINDTTLKKQTQKSIDPKFSAKMSGINLFNFLWAILYEITWHGAPEQRDETGDRLANITYDFKDELAKGNVEIKN